MKKILLGVAISLSICTSIAAQIIVPQDGKKTRVVISMTDNSVGDLVQILEQGTAVATGYGGTVTASSTVYKFLRKLPGEIIVDAIGANLGIGSGNPLVFYVTPTGGTQYWEFKPVSEPLVVTSVLAITGGTVLTTVGLLNKVPYSVDRSQPITTSGTVGAVVGSSLIVGGFIALLLSQATMTLVKSEP